MNWHTFLSDLASIIVIIKVIHPYISKLNPQFHRWGIKKTANLLSGIGLISSGVPMILLSANADTQMFVATGFIIPFIHPSIPGLTFDQASIFGNFANFFYCILIIGGLGAMIGATRILKFHKLRDPPNRIGY